MKVHQFKKQNFKKGEYAGLFYPVIPDRTYHVFSRANGCDKIFLDEDNYKFFLGRFKIHISPIADTFAYNLLPNHFHFLIRMKTVEEIKSHFFEKKKNKQFDIEIVPEFIMERFGNLLNSYAKSFNRRNKRKGGLFLNTMKRVEILNDSDFASEVFYIHKNAVHHQYVTSIEKWLWSSYHSLISNSPTILKREELLNFFGNKEAFIKFHQQPIHTKSGFIED